MASLFSHMQKAGFLTTRLILSISESDPTDLRHRLTKFYLNEAVCAEENTMLHNNNLRFLRFPLNPEVCDRN